MAAYYYYDFKEDLFWGQKLAPSNRQNEVDYKFVPDGRSWGDSEMLRL
jgi:hypothetical protein